MIQPLRRNHRWVMTGLALVLPVLFLAGLAARSPVPPDRWRLPGAGEPDPQVAGLLRPYQNLLAPDLIMYWSASPAPDGVLPADAKLLGSPQGLQAPSRLAVSSGYLLLYSLAHQQLVARIPIREVKQP